MSNSRSTYSGSHFPDVLIPGWFHSHKLYDMAAERCTDDSILVELGSYFGESTVYMALLLQEREIQADFYAIDLWKWDDWMDAGELYWSQKEHQEHDTVSREFGRDPYEIIKHYLNKYQVSDRVQLLQMDSIKAANRFHDETLDFLYLDTQHTYSRVSLELDAWIRKVKRGGIISGDDLGRDDDRDGGVARAVREFSDGAYETDGTTWFFEK